MRQLESAAAQLLLAVWRSPYVEKPINRLMQASLQQRLMIFSPHGQGYEQFPMRQLESAAAQLLLAVWRSPYVEKPINRLMQASLQRQLMIFSPHGQGDEQIPHAAARIRCCAAPSRCMAFAICRKTSQPLYASQLATAVEIFFTAWRIVRQRIQGNL